jgi:hypothetical protein
MAALRASEDPQDDAAVAIINVMRAMATGDWATALAHARFALSLTPALGIATEMVVLMWPIAIRLALDLGDGVAASEVLEIADGMPVGHLPPLLRAERALARARMRAADGDPDADAALAAAVGELRAFVSPYHLAHALLDRAEYLAGHGQALEAEVLRDEARAIGQRLGARPLVERADAPVATSVG